VPLSPIRQISVLISLWLFCQNWAYGQIVNVSQVANRDVKEGFSLTADLSWERKLGNSDLSVFAAKATAFYRFSEHMFVMILDREYGVQNQAAFSDRSFQHLRYRYQWQPFIALESFLQHDRNQFRRLDSRTLIGAGPRFALLITESQQLHLGIAPMKEIEIYEADSALTDEPLITKREENIRLSMSLGYRLSLSDQLSLSNTGYWQPLAKDHDNYRVLNDASLTLNITKLLALRFSGMVTHDSNPPPGIRKTDHQYKNSIVLNF